MPRPGFWLEADVPGESEHMSEDVWFCRKARSLGYEVWVDPTIVVGHIGVKVF